MGFEYISAEKLDNFVGNGDIIIVDLRKPVDYRKGHIRGAVNIPYNILDRKLDAVGKMKRKIETIDGFELDINKTIVFYCHRGSSSLAICVRMTRLGYNVKSVVGGISRYRGVNLVKG
ncbi:MAG: rhodanese-like domain-containing protein [Lachnospira sp.]|nr:rhodanese-like domain-containing protein [Lachnospira sp.]